MNVFKEMGLSIYSYGSYSQFLKNKKGKVFGFGVLLVLFYFMAAYFIPGLINTYSPHGSGSLQNFQENVPDFELKNGRLWMEDVLEVDTRASYLYIDTSRVFSGTDEVMAELYSHPQTVLIDAEKIVMKDNDGETGVIRFSDLDIEFNKADVEVLISWLNIIWFVILPFSYVWMVGLFFFGVLFVALLGMIAASCMNYKLSFGQLYLLGVYSRTLPLIVKALVSYLPFPIPLFWVINFGLSLFILVMVIKKMKEQEAERVSEIQ